MRPVALSGGNPTTTDQANLVAEIARAAAAIFRNADQLWDEACALAHLKRFSRALFLHQISLEECAKVDMLGAWATGLLLGHEGDSSKLVKALSSHRAKNRTNAYLLKANEEEQKARETGDWKGAMEAFRRMQADFHAKSNDAKNAAIYVDFAIGRLVTPDEAITESMVKEIREQNAEFLRGVDVYQRVLARMVNEPERVKESLEWFLPRSLELRAENGTDFREKYDALMSEWLERTAGSTARK